MDWPNNGPRPPRLTADKSASVIVPETKGDDRDNSDSAARNRLGRTWAAQPGKPYRYVMVFETHRLDDTYTVAEAKELIAQL